MPLNIRSEAVNQLARRKHTNKTEAVRMALENELRLTDPSVSLRERVKPLQERVMARPDTGLAADKGFYDSLYEED